MRRNQDNLPRLLVILDDTKQDPVDIMRASSFAGARMFMWRARHLSPSDYHHKARALALFATCVGATLLTHERIDVALAIAAQGTHLPGDGLPVDAARSVMGRDRILGKSLHDLEELANARLREQLTYATISPAFTPTSKPDDTRPTLGEAGIAEATRAAHGLKLYALGGVTPARVGACLDAGAYGVAVLGGISHADDPHEATLAYLNALAR